jgi:hypothetical protein
MSAMKPQITILPTTSIEIYVKVDYDANAFCYLKRGKAGKQDAIEESANTEYEVAA